jgi:hypothetical protein
MSGVLRFPLVSATRTHAQEKLVFRVFIWNETIWRSQPTYHMPGFLCDKTFSLSEIYFRTELLQERLLLRIVLLDFLYVDNAVDSFLF